MKGVILQINPEARIVDITHQVSPHNVDEAAFVLKTAYPYFPKGTVHVVVVDPEVGSPRRVLGVRSEDQIFVAPDNGVLKYVFHESQAVEVFAITSPRYFLPTISRTFHGRDIFAPVAAHLAAGVPLEKMGHPIRDYQRGRVLLPEMSESLLKGHVIYIDRFGNLITNISEILFRQFVKDRSFVLQAGRYEISHISESYFEGEKDQLIAVVDSSGNLSLAVNQGQASRLTGLQIGDVVTLRLV